MKDHGWKLVVGSILMVRIRRNFVNRRSSSCYPAPLTRHWPLIVVLTKITSETSIRLSESIRTTECRSITTFSDFLHRRCTSNYTCNAPWPGSSAYDKGDSCSCATTYLNIGSCCMSQNWIIGLACAAAGIVIIVLLSVIAGLVYTQQGKKENGASTEMSETPINVDEEMFA